ncbi:MAG: hypothetical protein KA181_08125 [Xylophilus sp.]|nr:hypothetical protein [Xylophilus sp.]
MKRYTFHILLLVIALLIGILLAMWFHRDGRLRNVHWEPPAAQTQDFASMVPTLPAGTKGDSSRFLAMLERPLFSPNRRPPPPPPPPAPVEVHEPLPNVHLYGLFGGESGSGAIVSVDGKSRRVHLNEVINGWTLSTIGARSVTFARGSSLRSIELVHVIPKSAGSVSSTAGLGAPASHAQIAKPLTRVQQIQEDRARRRAERAQAASESAVPAPTSP